MTQNGLTVARRERWRHGIDQQTDHSFRHYCVANSLGRHMHSMSAFYTVIHKKQDILFFW